MKSLLAVAAVVLYLFTASPVAAQAAPGTLSEAEVESLRQSSYVPNDRIRTYEKILDTRAHRIDELLKSRPHPGCALDLHDAIDQFAGIVDELNDNLDEYDRQHRDIRKALSRLITVTERWSATLKAPTGRRGLQQRPQNRPAQHRRHPRPRPGAHDLAGHLLQGASRGCRRREEAHRIPSRANVRWAALTAFPQPALVS